MPSGGSMTLRGVHKYHQRIPQTSHLLELPVLDFVKTFIITFYYVVLRSLILKCSLNCTATFKKKEYLAKHMKLKHAEIDLAKESKKYIPVGCSCSQKDDSESERRVTGMNILRYSKRELRRTTSFELNK